MADESLSRIKKVFKDNDVSGAGKINTDVFSRVLQIMLPQWKGEELNLVFGVFALDENGCLDYEKFLEWLYTPAPGEKLGENGIVKVGPAMEGESSEEVVARLNLSGFWMSPSGERYCIDPSGLLHSSLGYVASVTVKGTDLILDIPEWPGLGDKIPLIYDGDEHTLVITTWKYKLRKDPDTKPPPSIAKMSDKIAEQLLNKHILLIKGSYFEDCYARGVRFEMRQKIPTEWVWDPEEALRLWGQYRRLFMVIVSYGWLSPPHPDPNGFHLKTLAPIITKYRKYVGYYGVPDLAIAVDFCSLWQNESEVKGQDTRTKEMAAEFRSGLSAFNILYLHRDVTVLKLISMPEGEHRGYYDRGWTLTESTIIGAKSGVFFNRLEFDNGFDPEKEEEEGLKFIKKYRLKKSFPPLLPEDFQGLIEQMRVIAKGKELDLFTNGKDNVVVGSIYQEMFGLMQDADNLIYDDPEWSLEEADKLSRVLKGHKVRSLTIENSQFGCEGVKMIFEALRGSEYVKFVLLNHLNLKSDAAAYIVDVLDFLPNLYRLNVRFNCFTPEDHAAIRDKWIAVGKEEKLLAM